jgi:two-component system NarL family sensor kinase
MCVSISSWRSTLAVLCLFVSGVANAQPITNALGTAQSDSLKIEYLIERAWVCRKQLPDSSVLYAKDIIRIADQTGRLDAKVTGLNLLGMVFKYEENYSSALKTYHEALDVAEELGEPHGIGKMYYQIANTLNIVGDFDEAITNVDLSIEYYLKCTSPKYLAKAYNLAGAIHARQGAYAIAFEQYNNALHIRQEQSDTAGLASSYLNLGNLFEMTGDFKGAIDHFQQSLEMYQVTENEGGVADVQNSLGNVYYAMGQLLLAKTHYERSVQIKIRLEDLYGLAGTYHNLGIIVESTGDLKDALDFQMLSLSEHRRLGSAQGQVLALKSLAKLYLKLGDDDQAISMLQNALDLATHGHMTIDLHELYQDLATVFAKVGAFDSAYYYESESDRIKDYLNKEYNLVQALKADLEKSRSSEKLLGKDMEIKDMLLREENLEAEKKIYLILSLLLLVSIGSIVALFWIRNLRQKQRIELAEKNRVIELQQSEDQLKEQEISFADSVIKALHSERKRIASDLHDRLGGTLATVKLNLTGLTSYMESAEPEDGAKFLAAVGQTEKACDDVREIAHKMMSEELERFGLVPELTQLSQTISSSGTLTVSLNTHGINKRLTLEYERKIYKIIRELMTNVIKHSEATEANIGITRHNGNLNILVDDNGQGFDVDLKLSGAGMGMQNVVEMVEEMDGEVSIDSGKGSGTTISIDLSITKK